MQISIQILLVEVFSRSLAVESFTTRVSIPRNPTLSNLNLLSPDQSVASVFVPTIYSREEAQELIDETLMPQKGYDERKGLGLDAHGLDEISAPLHPNDPRLSMAYAEFPLKSMDELIDACLQYLPQKQKAEKISLVDLGSGCGRLVIYCAMTRGAVENGQSCWDIQGVEISDLLHRKALDYVDRGIQTGVLSSDPVTSSICGFSANTLSLNLGPVQNYTRLLQKADIVFAYSTAFPAKQFSPLLGALILEPEWSYLLSKACSAGCVAITTDRALDPSCGWELVDRLDVENREVFGTTGYIHVLRG